jgi:hypothetical protein
MGSNKGDVWPETRRDEVESALRASSTRAEAAGRLKVGLGSLDHACKQYKIGVGALLGGAKRDALTIIPPPPSDLPLPELVAHRKRQFERKSAHEDARRLIPIRVKGDRPIGILLFGDPHVDDDGTDLALLEDHARLVRETDGLYGASVGDVTNNWIGRLAHLYSQQGTTACDGWRLAEWFVGEVRDWMFLVGGNHDLWSGAGDPLKWVCGQHQALYQSSEVRAALRFQNGAEVRINCRHDFAGHSQWNPVHGPSKALMMGVRDHLAVAGHIHISGHTVLKDPDSLITMHALRVASYKRFDRYAVEKGMRDQSLGPCALVVIDPKMDPTHPELLKVFFDPHLGADYLTWKRTRARA